jgi:hypothetical protein
MTHLQHLMYVPMLCSFARMHVCMQAGRLVGTPVCLSLSVSVCLCLSLGRSVGVSVCLSVYTHVRMYVRMSVCMHACMYLIFFLTWHIVQQALNEVCLVLECVLCDTSCGPAEASVASALSSTGWHQVANIAKSRPFHKLHAICAFCIFLQH